MNYKILTADWHIREDNPICRLDDFWEVQKETIKFISDLSKKYVADIWVAGDIFHRWKSINQTAKLINVIKENIHDEDYLCFIAGNHDLKYHSMDNYNISDISLFHNSNFFVGIPYELKHYNFNEYKPNKTAEIIMLHKYCQVEKLPSWLEDEGITADELLEQNPKAKLIITGDNHNGFIYEKDNRFVINPGCITRQTVDKKEYKPFVVLFNLDNFTYEKIMLPDNDLSVVENRQLDNNKDRENRIESFISSLKESEVDLDYEDNLKIYSKLNKIAPDIINEIDDILLNCKN